MNKRFLTRGLALAVGLAAATAMVSARADDKKEEQQFCSALATLDMDVAQLRQMSDQSTAGQVRTAEDRVENDVKDVRHASGKMKSQTAKEFNNAVDQLRDDVRNVPDDATLAQARQKIQTDAQNVKMTGRALAAESKCPRG
jgi:hypothetical protein